MALATWSKSRLSGSRGIARKQESRARASRERKRVKALRQGVRAKAGDEPTSSFGWKKGDVVLLGGGMLLGSIALYTGLRALGFEDIAAGQTVMLVDTGGILVAWVGTYIYRVLTKNMTYNKQLQEYEEAVLQKRLEELPEEELQALMEEVEAEKQAHGNVDDEATSS